MHKGYVIEQMHRWNRVDTYAKPAAQSHCDRRNPSFLTTALRYTQSNHCLLHMKRVVCVASYLRFRTLPPALEFRLLLRRMTASNTAPPQVVNHTTYKQECRLIILASASEQRKNSCQRLLLFCGRFERSGVQASCRAPNTIYQTR